MRNVATQTIWSDNISEWKTKKRMKYFQFGTLLCSINLAAVVVHCRWAALCECRTGLDYIFSVFASIFIVIIVNLPFFVCFVDEWVWRANSRIMNANFLSLQNVYIYMYSRHLCLLSSDEAVEHFSWRKNSCRQQNMRAIHQQTGIREGFWLMAGHLSSPHKQLRPDCFLLPFVVRFNGDCWLKHCILIPMRWWDLRLSAI